MIPTKEGFYWALWTSPALGTHEADDNTWPWSCWQVVEVYENFIGTPCEADKAEKFLVFVGGVRESQYLDNFQWGELVAMPEAIKRH